MENEDDLDRYYAVTRYRRIQAARQLVRHGVPMLRARQHARSIPDKMPFVYSIATNRPVEPVLHYTLRVWKTPRKGAVGPKSLDTATAQAYDICDFLENLDAHGLSYDNIGQEAFDQYVADQSRTVSRRTGLLLSQKTILRRMASVVAFLRSPEFRAIGTADFNPEIAPLGGRIDEPEIHPLGVEEWNELLPELGLKPSEAGSRTCVLRLIADWAVLTGARRTELAHLTVDQVKDVEFDPTAPDQARIITLATTKGGRPRPLWVPNHLLAETRTYIEGERAAVLKASGRVDHGRLFVNASRLKRYAGKPVSRASITTWFGNAVRRADLKRRLVGEAKSLHPFVFHDLRHTFAVWTYVALEHAGRKRPWKTVQARLGHRVLETTEKIYLAYIEDHEVEISNLLDEEYHAWDYAQAA